MTRGYDGPERRLRQRRADDGIVGAQRDANERLVLRTFRAEDDSASARGGQEVAEDASRAKDEFLAMLGHELRNPLAPMVTALNLMRLRGDPRSREMDIIERQMQYVVRLVDDLLDVSRITRGKVELQRTPTELAAVVAVAVEMASPAHRAARPPAAPRGAGAGAGARRRSGAPGPGGVQPAHERRALHRCGR